MRLRVILQHLLLAPQTPQQSNHLVLLQGQVLRPLQLHRHQHHHQLGQKKSKCHRELRANNPPVAKAGLDQVVKEGDKVTLDGSAGTDPDNDPLTFSWEQLSPRQPTVKLEASGVANKVGFLLQMSIEIRSLGLNWL